MQDQNERQTNSNTFEGMKDLEPNEKLRLKIQPQLPQFPFRNHPFEMTIFLVDSGDHLKTGLNLPLNIELYAAEKMTPVEKQIMHIDPSTPAQINDEGICRIQVRISECSMAHGNRNFYIQVSPQKLPELGPLSIAPVQTSEMTVIQHRLVIQENLPELWFKDEGGRDKCMVLPVHLIDEKNERVGNRPVPLRVTLLYENGHKVLKQDILKMSPDSQRTIDGQGKAVLKLRIEDVSKNHQGQAFRLKVEADTAQSPMNFDVAYDLSSIISVRSKRNKRRPQKTSPKHITHHIISGSANTISNTNSPTAGFENGGAGYNGYDLESRKRMRLDKAGTDFARNPPTNVSQAMENVLGWTGAVVHGLHQLEWQPIGYESRSDGSPDPERPIYRCPACWRYKDIMTFESAQHDTKCLIANLLLTYATDTMGHLDYILKAIEKQSTQNSLGTGPQQMQSLNGMEGSSNSRPGGANGLAPNSVNMQHQMMMDDNSGASLATSFGMNRESSTSSTQKSGNEHMSTGPPTLVRGLTELINNMDGPPSLSRGNSAGLTDFMQSFEDSNGAGDLASYYQNSQPNKQMIDAIEMQVFYVLARMITLNSNESIGFPAFDTAMNLLGFYQESRDTATTEVVFVPLGGIPAVTPVEVSQAQAVLKNEMKQNSPAVHTLSGCNNNLVKLKEDVILFHWSAKDQMPSW